MIDIPDGPLGEVANTYVGWENNFTATEDEIKSFPFKRLVHYKQVREVITELPKTVTRKIMKQKFIEKNYTKLISFKSLTRL